METVEFHSYPELFNSLDSSANANDQELVVHSLSDLLGEYVSDDFDINDMIDHYSRWVCIYGNTKCFAA